MPELENKLAAPEGCAPLPCSALDLANGLLHAADDHPCCRPTLVAAASMLTELIAIAETIDRFSLAGHWGGCKCDHGCDGRMLRQGPKCGRCIATDRLREISKPNV